MYNLDHCYQLRRIATLAIEAMTTLEDPVRNPYVTDYLKEITDNIRIMVDDAKVDKEEVGL